MGQVGRITASMIPARHLPKFWAQISVAAEDECWPWTGYVFNKYGRFSFYDGTMSRKIRAHRAAWELHNRQAIPLGMTIDHSCGNQLCCNPAHLEPVGVTENTKRRLRGGPITAANTIKLVQDDLDRAIAALHIALRYADGTLASVDAETRTLELAGCQAVLDDLKY